MNYRKLNGTDLTVSELCFGPMRFDPSQKNEKGQNALDRAIDSGINFIHSSNEYKTIEQLGECLGKHPKRHDLHHIIKVNTPDYGEEKFDKNLFRRRIEDALRTLQTERIDVVQHLHRGALQNEVYHLEGNPKRFMQFPDVVEEMTEVFEKMRKEGKVGYLASFPMTPGYADLAINSGKFDVIVAFYNLIETEMTQFFPALEEKDMGFIALRPLLRGLITDKRADRSKLPDDDEMKKSKWDDAYGLFNKIQEELPELKMSWQSFAIKFCLSDTRIATVVMGLNTPAQVDAAIVAANGKYLDVEQIQKVMRILESNRIDRNTWN